jgi:hypothetical protein
MSRRHRGGWMAGLRSSEPRCGFAKRTRAGGPEAPAFRAFHAFFERARPQAAAGHPPPRNHFSPRPLQTPKATCSLRTSAFAFSEQATQKKADAVVLLFLT